MPHKDPEVRKAYRKAYNKRYRASHPGLDQKYAEAHQRAAVKYNEGWESKPQRRQPWTEAADEALMNHTGPMKEIADQLGRSLLACATRKTVLKKKENEDNGQEEQEEQVQADSEEC